MPKIINKSLLAVHVHKVIARINRVTC